MRVLELHFQLNECVFWSFGFCMIFCNSLCLEHLRNIFSFYCLFFLLCCLIPVVRLHAGDSGGASGASFGSHRTAPSLGEYYSKGHAVHVHCACTSLCVFACVAYFSSSEYPYLFFLSVCVCLSQQDTSSLL